MTPKSNEARMKGVMKVCEALINEVSELKRRVGDLERQVAGNGDVADIAISARLGERDDR